jgi:hypothetical protein
MGLLKAELARVEAKQKLNVFGTTRYTVPDPTGDENRVSCYDGHVG